MFDTPLGDLLVALAWVGVIYLFVVVLLVHWNRETIVKRIIRSDNDQAKD